MKKAIILLSAIMSVMPLTVMADEYIDPQTNVVYTYEPGQPTASVKAGYEEEVIYYERIVIYHPGSPDAAGDVAILDKFTVGTAEYVVTSINKYAFQRNKKIKSVIIPETVTDIGAGAFEYCDSLTAVQLPDGLTQIANELFYGCSQLVSVNIPSSVYSIGNFAFNNCSSLTDLTLPASLTIIGKLTFNDTPWFNALYNEAPDGPFYIGPQLVGYKGDAPTGELTIKDGTTSIGFGALRNCNGLTSVTIPESVAYIDYEAFYKCEGLTAVHITNMAAWCNIEFQEESRSSSNPLFYAHHLYLNGEEVTDLVIPDGVTSIGRYAFDNCTALTSVTIPDGVTTIGNYAFRSCGSLTNVTIPSSVTTINYWAFIFCYNLDAVHISDLAAWCGNSFYHSCLFAYGAHFYLKGEEVKDLVIPEGVAGIGNGTFEDYSYLTSVTIPKSVTTIGENAFNGCKNLTDVYCHADSVPSTEAWVFYDTPIASATLHVPAGSIEKYKTTSPWSGFGNIVALPEEPHQPLPFLEGNPIWVFKHESLSHPEDDPLMCWLAGNRNFTYYFLGGQKEIEGKVYTMMGAVGCNRDGEITLNHWLPVREENGIVYAFTDSLPGIIETEDNYDSRYNDEYNPMPYLRLGNECILYNFSTNIGETLYPQNEGSTVKAFDTYQLLDGTECRVLKTNWGRYDLYEKLGFLSDDFDGIMDPFLSWPMPTNGSVFSSRLNAYYQDNTMLYKAPDAPDGLCVNDTCWTRDETEAYAVTYKANPYHEKVMSYIRQLQGIAEPIIFTEGQMATIILPTEPDASKGKYYRLDRVEEGKIIFEQELQPHAHVPYIIVPSEDFSIDLNNMDLEGCSPDTVSIKVRFEGQAESQSIYFIGSYVSEELEQQEGCNIQFIDTTPDCSISFSEETGKGAFLIGALRAYLTWDDPYNQGGTKGRGDMEIVLRDYGTSIEEMKNEELRMKNDVFDLSGRKIANGQLQRGIYIENGQKKIAK